MLRKSLLSVGAGLLLMSAAQAPAQSYLDAGTWEFTLSGSGASNEDIDAGSFGIQGSIGYFPINQLEVAFRQTVAYADSDNVGGGTAVSASSGFAVDYHFDIDRFQPFIGAVIGYNYGDTNDTFFAGPEAGLKYFVKPEVFIYGSMQYQFFFEEGGDFDEEVDDGSFVYAVGIGFTF